MTEWRDLSRLPESEEYWRQLTGRMQESVHGIEVVPAIPVRSLAPLAWAAMAAALVAVIASSYLPTEPVTQNPLQLMLAPQDPTGAAWVERSGPPSSVEMLLGQMGRAR